MNIEISMFMIIRILGCSYFIGAPFLLQNKGTLPINKGELLLI